MRASEKTRRLTGLALMTAIIVVLQVVASFVKFGPFTTTLALGADPDRRGPVRPEGQARAWAGYSVPSYCWPAFWAGTPVERSCGMPIPS